MHNLREKSSKHFALEVDVVDVDVVIAQNIAITPDRAHPITPAPREIEIMARNISSVDEQMVIAVDMPSHLTDSQMLHYTEIATSLANFYEKYLNIIQHVSAQSSDTTSVYLGLHALSLKSRLLLEQAIHELEHADDLANGGLSVSAIGFPELETSFQENYHEAKAPHD